MLRCFESSVVTITRGEVIHCCCCCCGHSDAVMLVCMMTGAGCGGERCSGSWAQGPHHWHWLWYAAAAVVMVMKWCSGAGVYDDRSWVWTWAMLRSLTLTLTCCCCCCHGDEVMQWCWCVRWQELGVEVSDAQVAELKAHVTDIDFDMLLLLLSWWWSDAVVLVCMMTGAGCGGEWCSGSWAWGPRHRHWLWRGVGRGEEVSTWRDGSRPHICCCVSSRCGYHSPRSHVGLRHWQHGQHWHFSSVEKQFS